MSAPAGVVDGLLAGRYRLTSRLAAGAVGEVWRARDLLLDREVAVKTLRPEIADDEDARERFRVEARSAGRLSHPGIAAVYDAGEDAGRAWLVLELVEGESLQSLLRRQGRLTAERTLDVVVQTAAALQAAHTSGVVHRDVKPGNLLVRPDGVLKVTDFGIAAVAGTARLTRTGQVVGTAAYLSPEQAAGQAATAASDLYALGVVAYECLSGAVPFAYDTPVAVLLAHTRTPPPPLPDDVPAPVAELVLALLAKDPSARPDSAREVVRRATSVRASLPATAAAAPAPAVLPGSPDSAPSAATAVLPATPALARTAALVGTPSTPSAPPRPALRSRSAAGAGLAGRPGQRRAVRTTALLLGLLAVALGVRESAGGPDRPSPAPSPVTTTPATPTAPAPSGAAGPAVAPAPAPAEQDQGGRAPAQEQPAQEQPVQEPPGDGAGQDTDEAAEKAEKAAEKAAEQAERVREQRGGNDGGRGGGNGGGGNGGGGKGGG